MAAAGKPCRGSRMPLTLANKNTGTATGVETFAAQQKSPALRPGGRSSCGPGCSVESSFVSELS